MPTEFQRVWRRERMRLMVNIVESPELVDEEQIGKCVVDTVVGISEESHV